ncbi:EAL domain-containing protein [Malaciobacter molluscorum]|uniref:EAL domain-containing protein n=1 Tax=Malaciobacter molluscorum TaxID=1032072 RepID=UPI00100A6874|nr:EAL domain-containing protein [Malaciobacter molluscorum]RXJ96485.1 EAL domain-containing protein [Malaciobacter molluscorum]
MFLDKRIEVFFQPIISIKEKKIFAFEALTRSFDKDDNFISPLKLFQEAKKENKIDILDNLVRQKAINKFREYYNQDNNLLLFLNFESSVIEEHMKNNLTFDFIKQVEKLQIKKCNIVLEIKEDTIKDSILLKKFCQIHKKLGFTIAIDDFGTGYSSFDRLAIVKPDIVKIDRTLIDNIDSNYINDSILKSIVDICNKIGALTLAEGVERKEEILCCMKKHVDIYQGFYFEKAINIIEQTNIEQIKQKIINIGLEYKKAVQTHIKIKKNLFKKIKHQTKDAVNIISFEEKFHFDKISSFIEINPHIEAIYLIDFETGNQINDTIIKSISSSFYHPSKHNEDHSLKEYFYITKESKSKEFLSPKYISKASGSMCRTYAKVININNDNFIICFDILAD